jgi:shikimate dehydrogenase
MKQYGLVGYPLTHSFSKKFFNEKFEKDKTDERYENFEIDRIDKFPKIITDNPALAGLNVTIPYKEQVISYLDEIDEAAEKVGAVNTVKIIRSRDGIRLRGFNTDTWGFENALKPHLKSCHEKALILGTGGASKAIKFVLKKLDIAFISASIEELMENEIRYESIDFSVMKESLLIINCTPLGTYPKVETFPPIPYEYITKEHLLFDLVYNPEITIFMKRGKEKGADVINGYEMLLGQAMRSYEIWQQDNNNEPR